MFFCKQSVLCGVMLYGYLRGVLICDPVRGCYPFAPSSTLQRIASILCDVQIIMHLCTFEKLINYITYNKRVMCQEFCGRYVNCFDRCNVNGKTRVTALNGGRGANVS